MTPHGRAASRAPGKSVRRAITSWATCAYLFLAAAAGAFGSAAVHGPMRALLLGVSGALIVCGGMIIGIRAARHSDAAVERRLRALSATRKGPR